MADLTPANSRTPLRAALRAMPMEEPLASAWPAIAMRLQPRPRRRRWPLAIAAGLLALFVLPLDLPQSGRPGVAASPASRQAVELAALMAESAQLERVVSAASDDGASSATAAAWSIELEDRLQSLDAALEANRNPDRQLAFWQQRVELLRAVATLETSRHYLSSQGRNFDMALVSAY
jgi:hypothetical protein